MSTKHTPLPWENGYGNGITGPNTPASAGPTCAEYLDILAYEDGKMKTEPKSRHTVIQKDGDTIAIVVGDTKRYEANAELIVTAVNSHYDLVEALENVCEWYEAMITANESEAKKMFSDAVTVSFGPQREQLDAARAALSKAKGE